MLTSYGQAEKEKRKKICRGVTESLHICGCVCVCLLSCVSVNFVQSLVAFHVGNSSSRVTLFSQLTSSQHWSNFCSVLFEFRQNISAAVTHSPCPDLWHLGSGFFSFWRTRDWDQHPETKNKNKKKKKKKRGNLYSTYLPHRVEAQGTIQQH